MKYFFIVLFTLLLVPSAYAQENASTSSGETIRQEIKQDRQDIKQNKLEMRHELQQSTISSKLLIKDMREDAKEAFKQKLAAFKDKVKAERVDRISSLFTTINTNRTAALQKQLETMSNLLTKLEASLSELQKSGKDTASATQAVTDAKATIEIAKQAVDMQSKKTYTITISSESTVKTDIMTTRQSLFTDLEATHTQVKTAREKVIAAITQTKLLIGGTTDGK